ncbi:MAG TPA: cyclic nucleotide-binding domain-containing protein [Chloroflexia bacterium]|nr:cyclic nucleotide-binding domain-containing protein [Chloroflexia bacterium]
MLPDDKRVEFLRGVELFGQANPAILAQVAQVAEEVHIPAGTVFIKEGTPGDCLYILMAGEARVVMKGVGLVAFRRPKRTIGEMSLISGRARAADCVAVTDLTTLRIARDDFWTLMHQHPELALGAMRVMTARLEEIVQPDWDL